MVKFMAHGEDGKVLIGFGLSRGNIERLMDGQPILVEGSDLNQSPDCRFLIFFGEIEQAMQEMLIENGWIGPQTEVQVDPRLK